MLKLIKDFYLFLQGKKVFIIGIAGIIYGWGTGNQEMIYISLGMLGLRDAIRLK